MAASNLIQFKRGTSAALQTLINSKSGIDGCFYLTVDEANLSGAVKDSSRLYVGRADGSIVPVNQGITTVSATSELVDGVAHGDLHAGDFAYVSGDNIFAIYDGSRWVQINSVTDTFLETFQVGVSTTNGVATVTSQATLNQSPASGTGQTKTDSFTITGADGVTVSSSGKAITVTGDPYQLSSTAPTSNAATINLGHGANFGTSAGSISVSSANNSHLQISGNANELILDAPITETVNIIAKPNSGNGFNVQSTDTFGNNSTATTLDPTITYGENGDQTVHFQGGNATLDVYTKDEVDAIKTALNSMTYKGTVGVGGSEATGISGLTTNSVGDTYKVTSELNTIPIKASDGTISSTGEAKAGDLLIANTTNIDPTTHKPIEDANGLITSGTLYFDIVPSGDDTDTYYEGTAITHGWKIDKAIGAGSDLGGIALAEGTAVSLVDSGSGNNRIVTINHANVNAAAITATGSDNVTKENGVGNTFTAVTGMTVNEQGHVTAVTTKTLTLAAENGADLSAVAEAVSGTATHTGVGSKSSVTITTTAQMTKNNGSTGVAKSDSFTLSSDNLDISADATNKDAKVNFVWGTF